MNLWQRFLQNRELKKGIYFPYEGAIDLGVSESELIASKEDTKYLGSDIKNIILKLSSLGLVECIVRNSVAVHEKTCLYENIKFTEKGAIALNMNGLNARFIISRWHHAFSVIHQFHEKLYYSIEFFDEFGDSIQKVFLQDDTKIESYHSIINEFTTNDLPKFEKKIKKESHALIQLSENEIKTFQEKYLALKNIHFYDEMIKEFSLDRLSSYQYVPKGLAKKLDNSIWEHVLNEVRDAKMELMIFASNSGIVQIHTGKVHHIERKAGFLNIFDAKTENFSLHLKDDAIYRTWVVRRPVENGFVTFVEGFDKNQNQVIQFFGRRQEGQQELDAWQTITNKLLT